MPTYSKVWLAIVAACLTTLICAALVLPQSFRLTALSDIIQCVLLFSASMALLPQILWARGRLQLFWTLIGTGITFWFSYQLFWTYYEVGLRKDVPDLCAGDMVMFLHLVPLMAAVALRPHAPEDEYAARLRRLDFALMMFWWGYLYVLFVIPWQYVLPNVPFYSENLNTLYLIEKIAFLALLLVAWKDSKGGWKRFYANFFGASFLYAASSHVANWALSRHTYYSGSLYDIPLVASMAWITVIGLTTRGREPQSGVRYTSTLHGVWLARVGMIAAFSLPLFGAWSLLDTGIPKHVRFFRLVLTLMASLAMGIMVFVRQHLLDRELMRLLRYSRESMANLKRLQAQITESEKLASIGQLVGGAAHELNNPITAMLGYSDLLSLSKPLTPQQNELATKIGQHARRTKSLVASLLSFAKQGPATMSNTDLGIMLRTAVKLSHPHAEALKIDVYAELPQEQLLVKGDSNQLLQVFTQVIHDALHTAEQCGSRKLQVSGQRREGLAVITICDGGNSTAGESPSTLSGLGLSACQGILRQHQGRILWRREPNAEPAIQIELPLIAPPPAKSMATAAALPPPSFA
ncbi:MAG TPA: HAMP domain-containing sensor histidine kinase [Candidatus Binatia bacterium]|nr:HAMP domain-containing sensor histidine kinase [Candidatus Binatia bacterium]